MTGYLEIPGQLPVIPKAPAAVLDYGVDWSRWLAPDDETIVGASWSIPAGLTMTRESTDGAVVGVWLSGGTMGSTYTCSVTITTNQGRADTRSFVVAIKLR